MKIQFCCGGNKLEGWENRDADCDIAKPLPYPDHCATHIFIEHGLEHITHQEAWNFLIECKRILKYGGRIRVAIPDIERMWYRMDVQYMKAASPEGTAQGAIKAAIFNHGHKAAWTSSMLTVFLEAIGFDLVIGWDAGNSATPELQGIEGHGKVVGEHINWVETTAVEGIA